MSSHLVGEGVKTVWSVFTQPYTFYFQTLTRYGCPFTFSKASLMSSNLETRTMASIFFILKELKGFIY